MTKEFQKFYAATVYRAGQFTVGMSAADAEALCLEINTGRDPAKSHYCVFNGSVIYVLRPGQEALTANPGNWIVILPDQSLDVHADADFCSNFCAAAS